MTGGGLSRDTSRSAAQLTGEGVRILTIFYAPTGSSSFAARALMEVKILKLWTNETGTWGRVWVQVPGAKRRVRADWQRMEGENAIGGLCTFPNDPDLSQAQKREIFMAIVPAIIERHVRKR